MRVIGNMKTKGIQWNTGEVLIPRKSHTKRDERTRENNWYHIPYIQSLTRNSGSRTFLLSSTSTSLDRSFLSISTLKSKMNKNTVLIHLCSITSVTALPVPVREMISFISQCQLLEASH